MSFIIQEQASPVLFEIGKEEPTGAGGTIDFYLADQDFLYFEGNASANFAINLAYDAATTLDDALNVDDLVTVTLAVTNGATPYVLTNFQIDGGAGTTTINWQGGSAPVLGNANSIDYYIFKVLKISGNDYTVFASQTTTSAINQPVNIQRIDNTAASGAETIYLANEDILFFNATSTQEFTLNATFATGVTLNQVMSTGDVKECAFKTVIGTSATLANIFIDGSATTSLFFENAIPSATPGFLNEFSLQIAKTGNNVFNVDVNKQNYTYPGTPSLAPETIEVLVIAGGGGGSQRFSGRPGAGGGAGGYRENTSFPISINTNYTITVGSGGAGVPANSAANALAGPGTNSTFGSITSAGGGPAGNHDAQPLDGGSGAGGTFGTHPGGLSGSLGNVPPTVPSQGNNGGSASANSQYGCGGGGGATAAGGNGTTTNGGNGGAGTASSITGSSVTRGGGGGGGIADGGTPGSGGAGGGGAGKRFDGGDAGNGTPNTGGGGGGAGAVTAKGGNGGSGIVIMAFPVTRTSPTIGAGLTYTVSTTSRTGFKVFTFTGGTDTISWS